MDSASQHGSETAGVVARPPFLFLGFLVLGLALDYVLPLPLAFPATAPIRWTVSGGLILGGLAIAAAGIRSFLRARTPVPSNVPARSLVTTGIHGWSRNPIYVGMYLIYGGVCIAAMSAWMLLLALPLAITLRLGVVAREEAYLERRFGDAYRDYKARVRRWI